MLLGIALGALLLTIQPVGAQSDETRRIDHPENSDQQVDRFSARDPEGGNVYWSLRGTDMGDFKLGATKGKTTTLYFKDTPDYEMPMDGTSDGTDDNLRDNVYRVTVRAGDGGNMPFKDFMVVVTVTNENEDGMIAMTQAQPQVGTEVGVMDKNGMAVTTAAPAGIDDDIASAVSWQWASSDSMGGTYTDIAKDATDETYTPVEGDIGMFLMVTATYLDKASDGNTDERMVYAKSEYAVRARPMDNQPPAFPDQDLSTPNTNEYTRTARIPENTDTGMPIGSPVVATDPDGDPLIYSLSGDDAAKFNIDPKAGQILTKTKLDFEATDEATNCAGNDDICEVTVVATDPSGLSTGGTTPATSVAVTITVTDVGEAPAVTLGSALTAITSNEFIGGAAYTLTSTDTDYTYGPTTGISVGGTDGGLFEIPNGVLGFKNCSPADPLTADNDVSGCPDFENPKDTDTDNVYEIEVVASSDDGYMSSRRVTIKVENVMETGTVALSTRQGQVGVRVTATLSDPDGRERNVEWQWYRGDGTNTDTKATGSGNDTANFTPNAADQSATGNSVFVQATYTDAATSAGDEETLLSAVLPVRIAPDNNTSPEFRFDEDGGGTLDADEKIADGKPFPGNQQVAENQNARTILGTVTLNAGMTDVEGTVVAVPVTVTDTTDDGTTGSLLTYSLSGTEAAYFSIDPATGQISTKVKFDYEKKNSYTVMVKAADGSGASDSIVVNIKVIDLKENVMITGDRVVDYPENETRAVETYTATDPEKEPIAFSLAAAADAATADAALLSINPRSGALTFKKSPNYEKPQDKADGTTDAAAVCPPVTSGECDNVYKVTVNATADGQTTTHVVVIRVTNVPETPKFPSSTDTLTIDENTALDDDATKYKRNVGNPVTATDDDGANDPLTYSLSGPDAEFFTINPGTGQIKTAPMVLLDHEATKNSYTVIVTATDWSGDSAEITITIEVLDVDEGVEEINLSVSGPSEVGDYAENGTDVGTYEVEGVNAANANWTLEGADADDFRLSSMSGMSTMLMFSSSPDYEMPMDADRDNVYMVTLKATDPTDATITDTQQVMVTVIDVDEDGTVTLSPSSPVVGSMVTAELSDPDSGVTGTTWQWASASAMAGPFTDITGATSASYTPVEGDAGMYLRATATYDDVHDTDQTASSDAAMVHSADVVSRYDTNGISGIQITELFDAIADYFATEIGLTELFEVINAYFGR